MTLATRTDESRTLVTRGVRRQAVGTNRYKALIAVNAVSRNPNDELDLRGLSFINYMKNPVVLWAHDDRSLPIGRTLSIRHTADGTVETTFEFSDDTFATRVKNAWAAGVLNATSIRWLPLQQVPLGGGTTKGDLLEWSIVSIGADPDSLALRGLRSYLPPSSTTGWRPVSLEQARSSCEGVIGVFDRMERERVAEGLRHVMSWCEGELRKERRKVLSPRKRS